MRKVTYGYHVMKPKHRDAYRREARAALELLNIALGQDFHSLRSAQVEALLKQADQVKYQLPRNANGSRARYYYALLQRRAQQLPETKTKR